MACIPSARFIALSMVSPKTNWRPISRIARATAVRITGSPKRLTAPRRCRVIPGWSSSKTRPVSINAHVEALTSDDAEWPRCLPQSDGAILSSINSSMVSASGTRSSASAKHISAMPSSVERPYSAKKTSIKPGSALSRISFTRPVAFSWIRARSAPVRPASATNTSMTSISGAYIWASISERSGSIGESFE